MARKNARSFRISGAAAAEPAVAGDASRSGRPREADPLQIVGIGTSAGGLAALKTFFRHVPEDSGLAFVVVMHLSPEHESHLSELLQPHVQMPVQQVHETLPIAANHVYVIPPNANLESIDTHLRLSRLEERRQERAPIDHFFRTLSKTHDGDAIGVILTGTGSDGTLGLREIKARGGLTIVQDPTDAEYDGMPQSAIATGLVDQVLPISLIPEAILEFTRTQPDLPTLVDEEHEETAANRLLQMAFAQLRARTGRDFSRYKRPTIMRRIQRRMQLRRIVEFSKYIELLRADADEVRLLADDMLVTVTNFFRDPEVFEKIEKEVIPRLFDGPAMENGLRVWSVGCATGEEAYSLAILLLEEADRRGACPMIQVFASDLHERSLQRGREGYYPGDIETDVSPELLLKYFHKEDSGYRVRKEVRELVVFAPHNLMGDPPFSRLDLITCRNLMIYLQRSVQQEIVNLFHYALSADGYLVLGTSEGLDALELFQAQDKKCCIYRKRNTRSPEPRLPVFPMTPRRIAEDPGREAAGEAVSYPVLHHQLVEAIAPPSLLVAPDDRVVHLSSRAGQYIVLPGGEPTTRVYKMVRDELRIELHAALRTVRESRTAVSTKPIQVCFGAETRPVVLHVRPTLGHQQKGFVLVIFDELQAKQAGDLPALDAIGKTETGVRQLGRERAGDEGAGHTVAGEQPLDALEAELSVSRHRQQKIIEAYETTQEELKASNEELQSANEELRSTLEELETSKEELQSTNEELHTVNQENRHRVEELAQLTSDLQNLMAAAEIATLFLDRDLRILRFTPQVADIFNIRMTDRGRPLSDLTHRLRYDGLHEDARQVLTSLVPLVREVQDESGKWYLERVLPYRSPSDQIQGVVITLIDITERVNAETALRESEEQFRALVDASAQMVWKTDSEGRITEDSPSWRAFTGQSYEQWKDWGWLDAIHPDDRSVAHDGWCHAVRTALPMLNEFRVWNEARQEYRWTAVRAVPLKGSNGEVRGWVGMNIDINEQKLNAEALKQADQRKNEFLATLAHELRNPLAPIRTGLELMSRSADDAELIEEIRATIERQTNHLVSLVDDLLDVSRITRGTFALRQQQVRVDEVVRNALDSAKPFIDAGGHQLEIHLPAEPVFLSADPNRLAQVFANLLNNASKYTPDGGRIMLAAECTGDEVILKVKDSGLGISADKLGKIFEMFSRVEEDDRRQAGLGVGLTLAKQLVEMHGGTIEAESGGLGRGSEFRVRLPVVVERPMGDTSSPVASAKVAHSLRVLVVDDNHDAAKMLSSLVQQLGNDVRTVADGMQAVQMAAEFRPHVVLMDLGMPHMNGYEAAKQIRLQSWGKDIYLVALTGWGQDQDRDRTERAGFNAHVVKPAEQHTLRDIFAQRTLGRGVRLCQKD